MEKSTVGKIKELWEKWVPFTGLSILSYQNHHHLISHTNGNERAWSGPHLIKICCPTANHQKGTRRHELLNVWEKVAAPPHRTFN